MTRRWLHGREMTEFSAATRDAVRWLLIASPAWFRILLAWMLAAVAVPFAHLIVHASPFEDPSAVVPRVLTALIIWLLVCLAILARGLYDMARAFCPWTAAIPLASVLTALHAWAFFGIGLWL